MFADAAQFLLRTAFDLLACAFFMRFWMQAARVPFRNPFAQFVIKVTDFAVRPLRRMLPGPRASCRSSSVSARVGSASEFGSASTQPSSCVGSCSVIASPVHATGLSGTRPVDCS